MDSPPQQPAREKDRARTRGIILRLGQVAFGFALQALIIFLAVGRMTWLWGWVFLGIYLLSICVNAVFILQTSPDTVAERARFGETQNWDKVIGGSWALVQYVLLPLVAGLDARFQWTGNISIAWHLAGAILLAFGLGLFGWAMMVNAYFSTAVRIQTERGHKVCRDGPYRYVRHPGYAGTLIQSLGIVFLLGSWWGLLPAVIAASLMILRTFLEDRMLVAELTGYRDYAQETRFRLVPGLW